MFRPERMRLVAVMAIEPHIELLTAAVAREGILHLVDASSVPSFSDTEPRVRGRELLDRASSLEARVRDLVRRLKVPGRRRARVSLSQGTEGFLARTKGEVSRIEAAVNRAESRIASAHREIARYDELNSLLELVEGGDVVVEDLRGCVFDRVRLGFVATDDLPAMRTVLAQFASVHAAGPAGRGRSAVCVATSARHEEVLERALSVVGFTAAELPEDISGPIAEAREEVEERSWIAREDEAESLGEIKTLAEEKGSELAQWLAELEALRRIEEASLRYATTGTLEIMAGWIPKRLVGRLRRTAHRITGGRAVVTEISEAEAADAPPAPTALRNPPGVRAFESVVGLYGTPPYDGVDPTIFLALSFMLMYGAMFGDVGHGLVLLAGGLGLHFFFRPFSRPAADIGGVLAFCGLSSAAFGLLFGSIFGNDELVPALLFRPLEGAHVNDTLSFGIGIGVFMMSLGVALNVVQQAWRRRWRDALIGEWGLASLAFYWGLVCVLYYAATTPGATRARLLALLGLIVGPPVLLTAFRGPMGRLVGKLAGSLRRKKEGRSARGRRAGQEGEEDLMTTVIGTAVMLLETVTATFSHIRVAAFALNHVALCTAVWMIADVIRKGGAGEGLAVSALVLGNVIIVLLEGLIVFIQSMRLHFYEFFSKFFTGMGVPYKPLRIE